MENTEEANNETNEEIKEMSETSEQNNEAPVESRTIFQGISDEQSGIPDLDKEGEEQHDQKFISSSDADTVSKRSHHSSNKSLIHPKSHPSVGQYSLRSNTVSSLQNGKEIDSKFSPLLISRRTGKPLCNSFNQTSLIWERKPLAEILHPATAKIPPISEDTEKDMDADVSTLAEIFENKQASIQNSQSMEEEEPKNDDQLSEGEELKLSSEPRETKQSQDSTAGSTPTLGGYYYDPESSCPEELQIQFDPSPKDKQPLQLQQQITSEEGRIWVSQKTGKEVRSNFNQTSRIWEKKPLAEILQRSRTEHNTSNPGGTQSPED